MFMMMDTKYLKQLQANQIEDLSSVGIQKWKYNA